MKRLRERALAWARARQGDDHLPLTLHSRRIYILPTRAGIGAGVLLFIMLVAGLNYGNSLALLATFMLTGYAIVALHECHRTLKGLQLTQVDAADCFAGELGHVELRFANPGAETRCALQLEGDAGAAGGFELAGLAVGDVQTPWAAPRRGRWPVERLRLSTTAPIGLFRAWAWLYLTEQVYVYPRPEGHLPLPASGGQSSAGKPRSGTGHEEWAQLRPFQAGDSPRSVAWKLYARGAPLLVASYEHSPGGKRELRFEDVPVAGTEAKLSQLAQWVLDCERQGEEYALVLPDAKLDYGLGPEHRRAALRALAVSGLAPTATATVIATATATAATSA